MWLNTRKCTNSWTHNHSYMFLVTVSSDLRGPGSSVGIATGYGLDGQGIESQRNASTESVQLPLRTVAFAIGRTPYCTALRNVATVDISGNGQRKDSRSYYELIHDGYRKNGYSGHTSHFGHRSANVLYCGWWRDLWGLDRSLSGTWLSRIISTSYGDPSTSSIGNGTG